MKRSPLFFFLIALAVFTLDQATKYYIKAHVGPFDVIRVLPFFNIVYAENTGSAFGMFKALGSSFFIIISAIAVIVLSALVMKDISNRTAFALLLGGAAGNLIDRLLHGYVIDFLDVYVRTWHWPAFNVADSALTVGIVLLLLTTAFGSRTN